MKVIQQKSGKNTSQSGFKKDQKPEIKRTFASYPRWQLWLLPAVLVVFTVAVYYVSLWYPFEFDDYANILKYFDIRNSSLASLFFKSSRWISYWLNSCYYAISPINAKFCPFYYRLGNILIHVTSGLLVYCIGILAFRRNANQFVREYGVWLAYLVAGLFLLHPVQTQTVSYVIQGELEGLAGLFSLAMVACFLGYSTAATLWARRLCIAGLFTIAVLAVGSKEIIVVIPILLVLVDWFFVAQGNVKELRQRLWLHASIAGVVWLLYLYLLKPQFFLNIIGMRTELPNNLGNRLTTSPEERITPYYFCISQAKVLLHYLWIFIWPFNITVDYDWTLSRSFFAYDCFIPFLLLCCIGIWVFRRLQRNNTDILSFGLLWFFVVALPRCSIIPSTEIMCDYKTYLGSFGILLLLGFVLLKGFVWVSTLVSEQRRTAVLCTGITVLLIASGVAAHERNKIWGSPEQFWLDIIYRAPGKARAYNNYGVSICEKGKNAEAIEYFKRAIELDPYYADPYNNVSVAYSTQNKLDLAIETLHTSIELMPYHPETYNNLASMLMSKGEYDDVEKILGIAFKLRPHYGKAFYNLGNFYLQMEQPEKAWEAFKNCCTNGDLDNELGFGAYAKLSMVLKKYDDAIFAYQQQLARNPHLVDAQINLAYAYQVKSQYAQAEQILQPLANEFPDNMVIRFRLADLWTVQKKYEQALEQYQIINKLRPSEVSVYTRIASTLQKLGRVDEARKQLRDFIALNPPDQYKKEAQKMLVHL